MRLRRPIRTQAPDAEPAEPRARRHWIGGAAILLGFGASGLWCLFLLWLCYSAGAWILS
jgi:hypothetical protein